jgi:hypothetical protein
MKILAPDLGILLIERYFDRGEHRGFLSRLEILLQKKIKIKKSLEHSPPRPLGRH